MGAGGRVLVMSRRHGILCLVPHLAHVVWRKMEKKISFLTPLYPLILFVRYLLQGVVAKIVKEKGKKERKKGLGLDAWHYE